MGLIQSSKDKGFEDAFGKSISDTTTNEIDIGAHYRYTPERWVMFVDGSRVFPEYNTVDQYNHATDIHELKPKAGETVVFQTAERPRYVVQYEQEVSFAFSYSRDLKNGDRIRIGYFTDNNGWYMEKNSGHSDNEVDLVIRRNGSDKKTVENAVVPIRITNFNRLSMRLNWYNVGRALFFQTYTKNNEQFNTPIGGISIDDGSRGPQKGNLHLRYEVTRGSGNDALTLNAGSVGMTTLGDVISIKRKKSTDFKDNVGSTGTWVPLRAFRIKSEDDVVNVQIPLLQILRYGADDDIRISGLGMPKDLVSFTDSDSWSTPNDWHESNNVIETRTDIDTIPDSGGTEVSTADDPGGFQVQRDVFVPVDKQFKEGVSSPEGATQRRPLYSNDFLVIFGKSPSSADVTYVIGTEQDW